jgi:Peptidase A4 family
MPIQPFRFIGGTFFVPYVNCSATPDSFSAHWLGLDGFGTATVEQAGVLAACSGGTPHYAAWLEMFPRVPVYPHIAIRPGDSVTVSVFFQRSTRRFTIALADTSNGAHFSHSLPCPSGSTCRRTSAEAISEPPSSGGQIQPLTDFRAASFTGIRITDQAGHRRTLRSGRWDTVKIINMNPADSTVLDQPSQLFHGTAFDNYWMRST